MTTQQAPGSPLGSTPLEEILERQQALVVLDHTASVDEALLVRALTHDLSLSLSLPLPLSLWRLTRPPEAGPVWHSIGARLQPTH